jgi:ubiquinone/menaquinone biosynthesis C-methylase UbiE
MKQVLAIISIFMLFACSDKPSQEKTTPVLEAEKGIIAPAIPSQEQVAAPAEDEERTEWQNPDLVLKVLGDLTNKVVADVGAGSGYFAFKIARTAKKVIALDIDPNSLEYIKDQKSIVGSWANNIETRLTPPDVPNLLDSEADVVLIVNTYGYIPNKDKYLVRVLQGLKQGGRLVIIDFKSGDIPVGPSEENKVLAKDLKLSLINSGFKKIREDRKSLQYQYIITGEK